MKESTGTRIKKIMNDRNLKQVDILNLCAPYCTKYGIKLAKNDLSQYISDKVQPRQDKLSILGMGLNVSEAWLMGFDVPMERVHHNDHDIPDNTTLKAMALYERYAHAIPEVQAAVEALLRSSQSDS